MAINLPKITKQKKRLGRGIGSRGAKSGQGQKGQKSRAGFSRKLGFEGGQTPLYMRLPKGRGTKHKFPSQAVKPVTVSVSFLNTVQGEDVIGPGFLRKKGVIANRYDRVKLVGAGEVSRKFTVRVHAASAAATKAVESAGGRVEIIGKSEASPAPDGTPSRRD